MSTVLTVFLPVSHALSVYEGSYALLRRRMHTLRIADTQLAACVTMQDAKVLARRQYHTLAQRLHPDCQHPWRGRGRQATGAGFRLVAEAYAWIAAQPEGLLVPWGRSSPPPVPCEVLSTPPEDLGWGWHLTWY